MKIAAGVLIKNPLDSSLFLAFKRSKGNPDGGVSLPCGKSEWGEDPAQTAHRECLEETGWMVNLHMLEPFFSQEESDGFGVWIYSGDLNEEVPKEPPKFPEEGEVVWATAEDLISGPYGEFNRLALKHFGVVWEIC
jgi:ADP-ribose pyrophosphatase YjhB (NUDIX family)